MSDWLRLLSRWSLVTFEAEIPPIVPPPLARALRSMVFACSVTVNVCVGHVQKWREERDKLVSGLERILKDKDGELRTMKEERDSHGRQQVQTPGVGSSSNSLYYTGKK